MPVVQRHDIRVSDRDRQLAADRLQQAMDEGRLDLFEYDARLSRAYQSATYGELDRLFVDLPPTSRVVPQLPSAGPAARPGPKVGKTARAGLPVALKILWIVWGTVVAISLTTWILVSLGSGEPDNFWPMWLLIPTALLAAVSVGVQSLRRG